MRYGVLAEPADLAKHPPSAAQLRSVLIALAVLAALFSLLAPFARTPLPVAPEFVPTYQPVLIGSNLLTSILWMQEVWRFCFLCLPLLPVPCF